MARVDLNVGFLKLNPLCLGVHNGRVTRRTYPLSLKNALSQTSFLFLLLLRVFEFVVKQ